MSNLVVHIKNNIIIDKFRFTYYILKLKNKFRDWLWINVRSKTLHTVFSLHIKKILQKEIELKDEIEEEEEEDNIFDLINYW